MATTGHAASAAIGVAIAIGAWTYSAPPLRWSAHGLGELATAVGVGILVPLCAATAQGVSLDLAAIVAVLPTGAAAFVMMLAVEFPDVEVDAESGKRNLVVRLGRVHAASLALFVIGLAYVAVAAILLTGGPKAIAWLELLTLPAAVALARGFRKASAVIPRATADTTTAGASVAGRSVAFFLLAGFLELLGFLVPLLRRF